MTPKMVWSLQDAEAHTKNGEILHFTSAGETLKFGCGTSDNARTWMNRLQLCMNKAKGDQMQVCVCLCLYVSHINGTCTQDVQNEGDGSSLVGKILTGKPIMAGWISKHALSSAATKQMKWFSLTSTSLTYSDHEGQKVKREWCLADYFVITTRQAPYDIRLVKHKGYADAKLHCTFENRAQQLHWSSMINRVAALSKMFAETKQYVCARTHRRTYA